jgi:hypothetical protein
MSERTWRQRLAPVIAAVIAESEGQPLKEVGRRLREAWDDALLGPRKHWVYMIFRDECRKQLGLVKPKSKAAAAASPEQLSLWEDET